MNSLLKNVRIAKRYYARYDIEALVNSKRDRYGKQKSSNTLVTTDSINTTTATEESAARSQSKAAGLREKSMQPTMHASQHGHSAIFSSSLPFSLISSHSSQLPPLYLRQLSPSSSSQTHIPQQYHLYSPQQTSASATSSSSPFLFKMSTFSTQTVTSPTATMTGHSQTTGDPSVITTTIFSASPTVVTSSLSSTIAPLEFTFNTGGTSSSTSVPTETTATAVKSTTTPTEASTNAINHASSSYVAAIITLVALLALIITGGCVVFLTARKRKLAKSSRKSSVQGSGVAQSFELRTMPSPQSAFSAEPPALIPPSKSHQARRETHLWQVTAFPEPSTPPTSYYHNHRIIEEDEDEIKPLSPFKMNKPGSSLAVPATASEAFTPSMYSARRYSDPWDLEREAGGGH